MAEDRLLLKESLQKELDEVKARILAHEQLAVQLEFDLLKKKAKPQKFGDLQVPELKEIHLTDADRLRLRSAAAISKQELRKYLGIRISDYKDDPQQFVVELLVTNGQGLHDGPFFAAFKKNLNGSYQVIKSKLPHMIIMLETKTNFPLEDDQQLSTFVRQLHVCCEAFVERRDQVLQLVEVHNKKMITKVSYDEGYLFLELHLMLDGKLGKLLIFYNRTAVVPHKFVVIMKDAEAKKTWTESFKLLHKCTLIEALDLMVVKDDPNDTETEAVSSSGKVSELPPVKSPKSKKTAAKKGANSTSSASTSGKQKEAKNEGRYNFSDSSNDEANMSARMRKKKARIHTNIAQKTYWGKNMLPSSQDATSEDGLTLDDSDVESNKSEEPDARKAKAANKNKNKTEAISKKRAIAKKKSELRKKRRVYAQNPPPAASDSELSEEEVNERSARSETAPAAKSSAMSFVSPESNLPATARSERRQPALAAIFKKARQSLQDASPASPGEPPETGKGAGKNETKLVKTKKESAEASRKTANESVRSTRSSTTKTAKQNNEEEHPKLSQNTEVSKLSEETVFDSETSANVRELDSDTFMSDTSDKTLPRKVSMLKSNSQDTPSNSPETAAGSSAPGTTDSTAGGEALEKVHKATKKFKTSRPSLPQIQEEELSARASIDKDEPNVGVTLKVKKKTRPGVDTGAQSKKALKEEQPLRKSPRKKDGEKTGESGGGSKVGGVEAKKTAKDKNAASLVTSKRVSSVVTAAESTSVGGGAKRGKQKAGAVRSSPRRVEERKTRGATGKRGT